MKRTSTGLLNIIQGARHTGSDWAFFRELADGTGAQAGRRIDAWAMNLWPSKGYRTVAYEAKVSRADFARELADPTKRGAAEAVASECWFLTPAGLVRPDEVPEGWGLVEVREDDSLVNRKLPLQRKVEPPSLAFFAAVARRSADEPCNPEVAKLFGRALRLADLSNLVGAFENRRHQTRPQRGPSWWEDPTANKERRDRIAWIEAALRDSLGWGATRDEATLRARLEELKAKGGGLARREEVQRLVQRLATLVDAA
jgi:hypothetical protein